MFLQFGVTSGTIICKGQNKVIGNLLILPIDITFSQLVNAAKSLIYILYYILSLIFIIR